MVCDEFCASWEIEREKGETLPVVSLRLCLFLFLACMGLRREREKERARERAEGEREQRKWPGEDLRIVAARQVAGVSDNHALSTVTVTWSGLGGGEKR